MTIVNILKLSEYTVRNKVFRPNGMGVLRLSHPIFVRKWEWDMLETFKPIHTGREEEKERGKKERRER